ncbi:uncharacterized protein V1513DRAFT_462872 [Lipomyces chichibuensis]|uniref:uncharacterized protein n=1 Tax=Lipomyces chichibuensis TaxID=1546026 RepID=UPI003343BEA3
MSAPNTTYAWLNQMSAVGSSATGVPHASAQSAAPANQPMPSSAGPIFQFSTLLSQTSNSPTSQSDAIHTSSTGPQNIPAAFVDNQKQYSQSESASCQREAQSLFSGRIPAPRVNESTAKSHASENVSRPVSSSSSQKPALSSPFASLLHYHQGSEAATTSQGSEKNNGQLPSSAQLPSDSSMFGTFPRVYGVSTSQASLQGSRSGSSSPVQVPSPFSEATSKQPESCQELKAGSYAASSSLLSAPLSTPGVIDNVQVTSSSNDKGSATSKLKSVQSKSAQLPSSSSFVCPATTSTERDASKSPQSSVRNVDHEVEPWATAAPISTLADPALSLNGTVTGSINTPVATISPQYNESIAAITSGVKSLAEVQKEPSNSKPCSYGIDDEDETYLETSTTSLDSVATADMKSHIQTGQMCHEDESRDGALKRTNTFLITEIGVLTKQIQALRQENERLLKLAENATAIESQMQKVMEMNLNLTVKGDKMQNAFAIIDNESSLSVRTIAIYDCPHTVATVEDDLDFIMPEVVVIYSMHPSERTVNGQKTIVRTIKIKCGSEIVAQCIYYFLRWRTDYRNLRMTVTCSQPLEHASSTMTAQVPAGEDSSAVPPTAPATL